MTSQTGFEESGGSRWTTLAEEGEFLAAVAASTSSAVVIRIGRSVGGRPLRAVRIGAPNAPTVVLLTCTQHGDEPAPREACLTAVRDLATAVDERSLAARSSLTIYVVPTGNPDGVMANTRLNAAGTDVNRDHVTLASPEAFAIEQLVGRVQPDVLVDLHEFYGANPTGTERFGGAAPVVYDEDAMVLWPRNLNVDPEIYSLSKDLVADVSAAVRGGGYTVDDYGQYSLDEHNLVQIAGDGDEGILRNTGGLRNVVAMLIESSREPNLQRDASEAVFADRLRQRRVQTHRLAIAGAVEFALARGRALPAATDAARSRAVAAGASQSVPVYFGGADNADPTPEAVVDPPPCAYLLPTTVASSISTKLAALSIATELSPLGAETSVTMAQPSRPLIPLVLDGRGVRSSVAATPLYAC